MRTVGAVFGLSMAGIIGQQLGVGQVVARIGPTSVSAEDIRSATAGRLFRLETEIYELQKQTLVARISQVLLHEEARRRGVNPTDFLDREVYSSVAQPTEAEIRVAVDSSAAPVNSVLMNEILVSRRRLAARKRFERMLWLEYRPDVTFPAPRWPKRLDLAAAPRLGPADAKIRIVVFSDFECSFCAQLATGMKEIRSKFPETNVTFRHLPLPSHSAAAWAAQIAACAHQKGRFWSFHDQLFERTGRLTIDNMKDAWRRAGLEDGEFLTCFDNEEARRAVREDAVSASQLDLRSTPSLFVNERLVLTGANLELLEDVLIEERGSLFTARAGSETGPLTRNE